MKTSWNDKISGISRKSLRKIRKEFTPIAVVQFGSSLRPESMMAESDMDFIAITKRKNRDGIKVYNSGSIDVSVHLLSRREFAKNVKNGFPVTMMALKFGKILYDPDKFLVRYKSAAKPTENTARIWYENGWSIYSRAAFDYFSRSCAACYLLDCHHSARSFLRSFLLRTRGIVCDSDGDIILHSGKELGKCFKDIISFRRKGYRFLFRKISDWKMAKTFADYEARPLLALEKIVHTVTKGLEGKEPKSLRGMLKGVRGEVWAVFFDMKKSAAFIHSGGKFLKRPLFR